MDARESSGHAMLAGSHERAHGPECRCGRPWPCPEAPTCDGCGHLDDDCICAFLRDEWPAHHANPEAVDV